MIFSTWLRRGIILIGFLFLVIAGQSSVQAQDVRLAFSKDKHLVFIKEDGGKLMEVLPNSELIPLEVNGKKSFIRYQSSSSQKAKLSITLDPRESRPLTVQIERVVLRIKPNSSAVLEWLEGTLNTNASPATGVTYELIPLPLTYLALDQLSGYQNGVYPAPQSPSPPVVSGGKVPFLAATSLTEFFSSSPDKDSWDKAYDDFQLWKYKNHLPISFGAQHWLHVDQNERVYGDGYGIPKEKGTFFWWVDLDPTLILNDGPIDAIGAHIDARFRESQNYFHPYNPTANWINEGYAWLTSDAGLFKAGVILKKFGLTWDNSWWGSVQYFDGFALNSDYGASWERRFAITDDFWVDASAQYFVTDNRISGGLGGSTSETVAGLHEQNTGVTRVAPTWKIGENSTVSWGISSQIGGLSDPGSGFNGGSNFTRSKIQRGWASDVTVTLDKLSLYGEVMQNYGTVVPVRYVSGGASNQLTSFLVGANYIMGPVGVHCNYSMGWDYNPGGRQYMIVPGVSIAVAKNVQLLLDYVKWDVVNRNGFSLNYGDSFESVLAWRF